MPPPAAGSILEELKTAPIFSKRANISATGRAGEAEGPGEMLQSPVAVRKRMLREENEGGLGETSSNEFKGNKGDGRTEEGKGALEKRKRLTERNKDGGEAQRGRQK